MSMNQSNPKSRTASELLLCSNGAPPRQNSVGIGPGMFDDSDRGALLAESASWHEQVCLLDLEDLHREIRQELGAWPNYEYLLEYGLLCDFVRRYEGTNLGVCLVSEEPAHRLDLVRTRERVEREGWRFIVASERLRDTYLEPVEVYVACELELLTWQSGKRAKAVIVSHRHTEAIVRMLDRGASVTLIGLKNHMPFELLDLAADPTVPCTFFDLERLGAIWLPPRSAIGGAAGQHVGD